MMFPLEILFVIVSPILTLFQDLAKLQMGMSENGVYPQL